MNNFISRMVESALLSNVQTNEVTFGHNPVVNTMLGVADELGQEDRQYNVELEMPSSQLNNISYQGDVDNAVQMLDQPTPIANNNEMGSEQVSNLADHSQESKLVDNMQTTIEKTSSSVAIEVKQKEPYVQSISFERNDHATKDEETSLSPTTSTLTPVNDKAIATDININFTNSQQHESFADTQTDAEKKLSQEVDTDINPNIIQNTIVTNRSALENLNEASVASINSHVDESLRGKISSTLTNNVKPKAVQDTIHVERSRNIAHSKQNKAVKNIRLLTEDVNFTNSQQHESFVDAQASAEKKLSQEVDTDINPNIIQNTIVAYRSVLENLNEASVAGINSHVDKSLQEKISSTLTDNVKTKAAQDTMPVERSRNIAHSKQSKPVKNTRLLTEKELPQKMTSNIQKTPMQALTAVQLNQTSLLGQNNEKVARSSTIKINIGRIEVKAEKKAHFGNEFTSATNGSSNQYVSPSWLKLTDYLQQRD